MLNYLKNFIAKLALLPVLTLLGGFFLLLFLLAPQFKVFKDKAVHWGLKKRGYRGNQENKKDYEAFY